MNPRSLNCRWSLWIVLAALCFQSGCGCGSDAGLTPRDDPTPPGQLLFLSMQIDSGAIDTPTDSLVEVGRVDDFATNWSGNIANLVGSGFLSSARTDGVPTASDYEISLLERYTLTRSDGIRIGTGWQRDFGGIAGGAVLVDATSPEIGFQATYETELGNADFTGGYHMIGFAGTHSWIVKCSLDGSGGGAVEGQVCSLNTCTDVGLPTAPLPETQSFAYDVQNNGDASVDLTSLFTQVGAETRAFQLTMKLEGGVVSGGNILALGGDLESESFDPLGPLEYKAPGIAFAFPESAVADLSTLSGAYAWVELMYLTPQSPMTAAVTMCASGLVTFDGQGAFTASVDENINGVIANSVPRAGDYTVDPDGVVNFISPAAAVPSTLTHIGAVDRLGSFAAVVTNPERPVSTARSMIVFMRIEGVAVVTPPEQEE